MNPMMMNGAMLGQSGGDDEGQMHAMLAQALAGGGQQGPAGSAGGAMAQGMNPMAQALMLQQLQKMRQRQAQQRPPAGFGLGAAPAGPGLGAADLPMMPVG
jgi:hypothetical protein